MDIMNLYNRDNLVLLLLIQAQLNQQQMYGHLLTLFLVIRRKRHRWEKNQSCWVRPWLAEAQRRRYSQYFYLVLDMKVHGPDLFKNYMRLPPCLMSLCSVSPTASQVQATTTENHCHQASRLH